MKLERAWVELQYKPTSEELAVLVANTGSVVRVLVENSTIVGVYA